MITKVSLRRAKECLRDFCIQSAFSRTSVRCASTGRKIFRENDIVLLKQNGNDRNVPVLAKPLRPEQKIRTERGGSIDTDNILGKPVRDIVYTSKGVGWRIHEPSLGEYTDLSPRLVTPIYSQDTSLIVSLLDLHPSVPGGDETGGHDRIEIFEAGTGHGALTLNLARAIHGANRAAPPFPELGEDPEIVDDSFKAKETQDAYEIWRANRRAIIHTLDQSAVYSKHAEKTVKNFRQGMYLPHVDFHVGSIEDFLSKRLSTSSEPFLDHAILDLPNTHLYLDIVGKALKPNGSLVTWCPSITQIIKCFTLVKDKAMPFFLEKVVEVGPGISGGREWDVRRVRPRAFSKVKVEAKDPEADDEVERFALKTGEEAPDVGEPATQDEGWEMVCRPKVGLRTFGGGFIALWRRTEW